MTHFIQGSARSLPICPKQTDKVRPPEHAWGQTPFSILGILMSNSTPLGIMITVDDMHTACLLFGNDASDKNNSRGEEKGGEKDADKDV
jgi:hypothetical protein